MNPEALLREGAAALDFPLSEEQAERLMLYFTELRKWMRRINLVARDTTEEQLIELHFLDSLILAPLVAHHPELHLLDIGSGAGFPGLVLAAVLPEARFTLVEPRQKRAVFLRHVARLLGLNRVQVVKERVETLYEQHRGAYSHITGRAVADPAAFLAMAEPLIAADLAATTEVILFLARPQSLETLSQEIQARWRLHSERSIELPFTRAPRYLACLRRVAPPKITV